MVNAFNKNGLQFWNEKEIKFRNYASAEFAGDIYHALRDINSAWSFTQIEAPILTPTGLINDNYTEEDVWFQTDKEYVLRPETTPSSYAYAEYLLFHQYSKPPCCVTQNLRNPLQDSGGTGGC